MSQLIHVNSGRIYSVYKKDAREILYTILLATFPHRICKAKNVRNVINHRVVSNKEKKINLRAYF